MDTFNIDALELICETDEDKWSETSLKSLMEGVNDFNRYEIKELIAVGGMKEIYKAYDSKNNRYVALAKLRPDGPDEQCEDFLKEAQLTASLEHPNIISLYDIGVSENGMPLFTMELKVGDSLAEIIGKKILGEKKYLENFDLRTLLHIFLKVCDAISYAHQADVLHLDIKPDNIQVGTFGEVQVCDWGLGLKINDDSISQPKEVLKGTPGFMAPEQLKQDSVLNRSTDIYSLGALLYSILTETEPVDGGINTVLRKTLHGDLTLPKEKCPDKSIPESLNAVVDKAMSFDKESRYASVEELRREVENYLSGRSTSAENAGFMKEVQLLFKRNKAVSGVIVISIVIFMVTSTTFLMKLKTSNDELTKSNFKVSSALSESQKNYAMYKEKVREEKKLTQSLLKNDFVNERSKLQNPLFYTKSAKRVDDAIREIISYQKLSQDIKIGSAVTDALFISHRFKEILELKSPENPQLIDIVTKFAALEKNEKDLLKEEDFLSLLQELNKASSSFRQRLMERSISYYIRRMNSYFANPGVVKELIKCWNPDWNMQNFIYEEDNLSLKIWGENLKILKGRKVYSSLTSFLCFLKINKLDINNSSIRTLSELDFLHISSLDISSSKVIDLKQIRKIQNLNSLYISKGQFSQEDLNRVYSWVKIEEK